MSDEKLFRCTTCYAVVIGELGECPYCQIVTLTAERDGLLKRCEELRDEVYTLKRVYNQLFDACKSEQERAEAAEKERDKLLADRDMWRERAEGKRKDVI